MCMYLFNLVYEYVVCSMCLNVYLCALCMRYPWKPEEGIRFPGTGVTDDCELPAMWVFEIEPGSSR